LRFSVRAGNDYLNWAANLGGASGAVGGLVLLGDNRGSGSFFLELPFVGDDNGTVSLSAHGPVHIEGSFICG
jgi:hypothetical protein